MKKSLLPALASFVFAIALPNICYGQQTDHLQCTTSQRREALLKKHPEILAQEAAAEMEMKKYISDYRSNHAEKSNQGKIIIPLVFHILNQGGSENISDEQVRDEVRIMNLDYNKLNYDTIKAVGDFPHIIADMGVTWRLANIDPNGNCTNGIDRITTDQTNIGDDYSKLNGWDRTKYINVWVARQFLTPGDAGYAYYATDVQNLYSTPWMDGVILINSYIGSIGTSDSITSRALTHEIGHCFDLEHTWGNTNTCDVACGDDDVDDTPPTKGYCGCPNSPLQAENCTPGVIENYQNFMEYSYCSVMFTEGQKERWIAAANSKVSGRNNLWSSANLVATGTADTFVSPCAPIAGFYISQRYICSGGTVTFLNSSGNADSMNYLWTFPNGNPATSTAKNPTVQFSSLGWQTVSLTASNSLGSTTKTDSTLLFVGYDVAQATAPYYQGFDDANVFNTNNWVSINYDAGNAYDNNVTWFKQTNSGYHNGSGAAMLNNYDAHANGDVDEIISPAIDLTGLDNSQMNLSFYYSGATSNPAYAGLADSLAVKASTDCGSTWTLLYKAAGTTLENAGYVNGRYVPEQNSAYWQKVNIPLNPNSYRHADVLFKFQAFTTIEGNNLYLDDINIGDAATAITETGNITAANIHPDPSDGNCILSLALLNAAKVNVKVYNMAGQQIMQVFDGNMADGETQLNIDGSLLASGVYVVNINAGGALMQKKMVIK